MSEFIRTQQEARANLTMQIREVLESAESEGRGLDVAGSEKIDRIELTFAVRMLLLRLLPVTHSVSLS